MGLRSKPERSAPPPPRAKTLADGLLDLLQASACQDLAEVEARQAKRFRWPYQRRADAALAAKLRREIEAHCRLRDLWRQS